MGALPISDKISGINVIQETTPFALLQFDKALNTTQQKLYYMAIASVKKEEDPEAQALYSLDIRKMAEFSDVAAKGLRQNLRDYVNELDKMDLKLRSAFVEDGKLKILFGIFQSIEIDKTDPNKIDVRFNYDFRKQILKMKCEYDIEYPTKTIMMLKNKLSIPLYTYLVAEAALIREKRTPSELSDLYIIQIDKETLLKRLNYTNNIGTLNRRDLPAAVKDINENSEIFIENGMPEIVKKGRFVSAYTFRVHITTSIEKPIFARSLVQSRLDLVPKLDYILSWLEKMGVAKSHIRHFASEKSPDFKRLWGNVLYSLYQKGVGHPAYFRASYDNNWFDDKCKGDIEFMFRLLMTERPDVADEYMRAVHDECTQRGLYRKDPDFFKDIMRHFAARNTAPYKDNNE